LSDSDLPYSHLVSYRKFIKDREGSRKGFDPGKPYPRGILSLVLVSLEASLRTVRCIQQGVADH
jgi:hypothetical protein